MNRIVLTILTTLTLLTGCKPNNQQLDNRLQTAIIRGNLKKAQTILNQSNKPAELATQYLNLAMIHTPKQNSTDMVKLLVENGADLNSREHGGPAVITGLKDRNMTAEFLQWCIDNGFDVNQTDSLDRTALEACYHFMPFDAEHSFAMIQILIDNGANVNISVGNFPILFDLVIFGDTRPKSKEMLELFIASGLDIETKDRSGKTALLIAIEHGKEDMARLLLEHSATYDVSDEYGTTALFVAASMGYTHCVEMLIAQGADVSAVNTGGYTPLRFAINHPDNTEIIELLLDAGADVNHVKNGKTVLDAVDKRNTCQPAAEAEADKQQLITLLRKHGAKRADELTKENI